MSAKSVKAAKMAKAATPKEKRPLLGPGPNAYRLPPTIGYRGHDPSRFCNPMYSFRGRDTYGRAAPVPGPEYKIHRVTHYGPITSPAYSFGRRFPSRAYTKLPGPGAHAPERCPPTIHTRPPMYSFGARLSREVKRPGPGPNAYKLRRMTCGLSTPAWTMGARLPGWSSKHNTPGPSEYYPKNLDVYRPRDPKYSLGARLGGLVKSYRMPSPACYSINNYDLYNRARERHSFGTKHSEYAPPLMIKEDNIFTTGNQ